MDRAFLRFALALLTGLALLGVCNRATAANMVEMPDRCDRVVGHESEGRRWLGKQLPTWLLDGAQRWRQQQRMRAIITMVADELGAGELEAEMLWRMAIRESSGNPRAVHVLSPDMAANRGASRHRRDSPWASALVVVFDTRGNRLGTTGAWALGRGLYGQVTGYHARRWPDAPPWSLCDPIVATVTTIWAMRSGLDQCHGETLRDAHRRFASGRCELRDDARERAFDRLARGKVRGLSLERFDPDAAAGLGDRWPEDATDREALLSLLTARARAHGLVL
jgi:hypothetical protein